MILAVLPIIGLGLASDFLPGQGLRLLLARGGTGLRYGTSLFNHLLFFVFKELGLPLVLKATPWIAAPGTWIGKSRERNVFFVCCQNSDSRTLILPLPMIFFLWQFG
jgi:hypothetical protein